MGDSIKLSSANAQAEISTLGAELRQWRIGGRDLLWTPDEKVWPAVSPILFPIVGWAREGRIQVDGLSYELGVHGFAAQSMFDVERRDADCVRLVLRENVATLARYPFRFELVAEYRLAPDALSITLEIVNPGKGELPYACGLHPGFRWPLGGKRDDHRIVFDQVERPDVPVIARGGLFAPATRPSTLVGRVLPLSDDVLATEALCFLDARSRGLDYDASDGSRLRVESSAFAHWALWSRPPAPFLCIESWTGHGDPVGFDSELRDKPSMILLAPGERRRHSARYAFSAR